MKLDGSRLQYEVAEEDKSLDQSIESLEDHYWKKTGT